MIIVILKLDYLIFGLQQGSCKKKPHFMRFFLMQNFYEDFMRFTCAIKNKNLVMTKKIVACPHVDVYNS